MIKLAPPTLGMLMNVIMLSDEEAGIPTTDLIPGQGIMHVFAFHPERIEEHHEAIHEFLLQLPTAFRQITEEHPEYGGGGSFLSSCLLETGEQWTGEQYLMEQLMAAGVASGWVKLMPKKFWALFPGNMPYYLVVDERLPKPSTMTVATLQAKMTPGPDAVIDIDTGRVTVTTPRCMHCHKDGLVTMPLDAYEKWQGGEYIQRAWPEGSAGEREQLINGTHPECFEAMFPEEEN